MGILVKDLNFTYPGAKQEVVKGINFEVERGEIFSLLGPSGAGKSTVQKILFGLLKGYSGTVRVLGRDMSRSKPDFYEKIGVAYEVPNLYERFTALENLRFFASLYAGLTRDPHDLLERVGLEDAANTRVGAFSKGMKVRLNFIRAILHDPEIVFLDEPTSGLDPSSTRRLKDILLEEKQKGKTIFLSTHDMFAAEAISDRVAFMVYGFIKLVDSPRNLKIEWGEKKVRVECRLKKDLLSQEFPVEGIGENPAFLSLIRENPVETIHTQEATLEDIFIRLTGRELK
ncbi:MAG: ABC transporter ATP-binding protein [Bacillota bacterium]|nr:ABC transporter ATP-binding protein [Bacillota bacterium]